MNFEALPNELLLYLFDFIPPLDLFCGLSNLNSRLNKLVMIHYRNYRFDFRSLSREQMHLICQKYLPLIIDKVIYLHLSDDECVPGQSVYFFSHNINLDQFTSLTSLTLFQMKLNPKIGKCFSSDIQNLNNLTHLKFVQCFFKHETTELLVKMINKIWGLPRLIYCYLDAYIFIHKIFRPSTVISLSLRHLYIQDPRCTSQLLTCLMEKTPYLQYFSMEFRLYKDDIDEDNDQKNSLISMNLPIKKLKLLYMHSRPMMMNLFYMMPNLSYLNIETWNLNITGYEWEQIIINQLPKLEIFHLNMFIVLNNTQNKEEQIDQLLDGYRSVFWIETHRWFIGCIWRESFDDDMICLYTLPFNFHFSESKPSVNYRTITTCPSDIRFSSDRIHRLSYDPALFTNTQFSSMQFNRIEDLHLSLPYDHQFLSIIPNFDHLLAMSLILWDDYPYQLQSLLDKMSRLYSLTFALWSTEEFPPFNLTSKSVRSLDLEGCDQFHNAHRFNEEECKTICKLPLAIQCQELRIEVSDLTSIVVLIHMMKNLRLLYIRYLKDSQSHRPDLVQFIKKYAPTTSIVTRQDYGTIIVRL